MDRDRRFKAEAPAPAQSDAAAKRRLCRAIIDDTRRKIERKLLMEAAAEELAKAAQAVLMAAEAEKIDLNGTGFGALCTALAKYQEVRRG